MVSLFFPKLSLNTNTPKELLISGFGLGRRPRRFSFRFETARYQTCHQQRYVLFIQEVYSESFVLNVCWGLYRTSPSAPRALWSTIRTGLGNTLGRKGLAGSLGRGDLASTLGRNKPDATVGRSNVDTSGGDKVGGAMPLKSQSSLGTPASPLSGLGRQSRAGLPGRAPQPLADKPGARKPVARAPRGNRGSIAGLPAAIRALAKRDSMSLPSHLSLVFIAYVAQPHVTVCAPPQSAYHLSGLESILLQLRVT